MKGFNVIQFLLFFRAANIYCHGDHEDESKVLLVHIQLSSFLSSVNINTKFSISLPLRTSSIDSIANGCYQSNASKCEPVWATNELNNFQSVLIGWPNNVFNNFIWPSFSAECNSIFIPLNLKFDQLIRWVTRPKATLGMISTNINSSETLHEFLSNLTKQVDKYQINTIIIVDDSIKESRFFAIGPKFVHHDNQIKFIRDVDIKNIIVEILELKLSNNYSDGNKTIAHLLTVQPSHHKNYGLFKIIFLSVIITGSTVIGCLFIVEAIKNACNKKQKMNHHYNLGLNDISNTAGYPEKTYLLSVSDEDELFSDAMQQQHIQITPTSQ